MPKVSVPQDDGEIRIAVGGDDPTVYPVTNGTADVPEEDLDLFLFNVDGAELVESAAPARTTNITTSAGTAGGSKDEGNESSPKSKEG
jgi:hypothetical protein